MDELNVLNIPAFKRKRSISARGKKQPSYMRVRPERKTRARRSRPKLEESLIDIPIRQSLPSQDLFPSPIIDDEEIIEDQPTQNTTFREMKIIGRCEGYFDKIEVAVVELTSSLRTSDSIIFETNEGLFEQEVTSMQINRKDISLARAGSDIGLKVMIKPKVGGMVYKSI